MFKITAFNKRKETLSEEEFIAYWQKHSEKVIGFKDILHIKHYTKTFPLKDDKASTQRQTLSFEFDAMGELWYENEEEFLKARTTDEGKKALAFLREDEEKFCDMKSSVMWFGTEEDVF